RQPVELRDQGTGARVRHDPVDGWQAVRLCGVARHVDQGSGQLPGRLCVRRAHHLRPAGMRRSAGLGHSRQSSAVRAGIFGDAQLRASLLAGVGLLGRAVRIGPLAEQDVFRPAQLRRPAPVAGAGLLYQAQPERAAERAGRSLLRRDVRRQPHGRGHQEFLGLQSRSGQGLLRSAAHLRAAHGVLVRMKWLSPLPLALLAFSCYAQDSTRAASSLRVHVNQVALERTGPKAAIVEYAGPATTGTFAIVKDGAKVQTGSLAALPQFTEWREGKKYFKADFSSLSASGSYSVDVTLGETHARSPSFVVGDNATFVTTASAVLDYFHANRHTKPADRHIRVFDSQRYVDVWGGWKDAGGDYGKYLSHLSYANFFNPQQTAMVVWALAASHDAALPLYRKAGLEKRVVEEALWGADFLHRLLDKDGYFYMTVFDRWATPGAERMVVGYVGIEGVYTKDFQAAFREGGGVAIAGLARASRLSKTTGISGEFSAAQYLQDAERAFAHLQANNLKYCDDGVENIIDDYTALLAAVELYRATQKDSYLEAARVRASNLNQRLTPQGWFRSDAGTRPFYHSADAGFPVVSL